MSLNMAWVTPTREKADCLTSLMENERNDAQIEKELFAILFQCRRFHHYIYGLSITGISPQALRADIPKTLYSTPTHLQSMLLQLVNYDLNIINILWNKIPLADSSQRSTYQTHIRSNLKEQLPMPTIYSTPGPHPSYPKWVAWAEKIMPHPNYRILKSLNIQRYQDL